LDLGRNQPSALDREAVDLLTNAFVGACTDLGVTEKTPYSRTVIAEKVFELFDDQCDAEALRAAVVTVLKRLH